MANRTLSLGSSLPVIIPLTQPAVKSKSLTSATGQWKNGPRLQTFWAIFYFLRDGQTFSIRHLQNFTKYMHTRIFMKSESVFKTRATILFLSAWSFFIGEKTPKKSQCQKMKTSNTKYTKSDYPDRFALQNC